MSRPISESLSLLSETLGNCKTNLKEKSVEDVDNIKISDVDEKIAEIQAGGSGINWDNPKYIQLEPKSSFSVYSILEGKPKECEVHLTIEANEELNGKALHIMGSCIEFQIAEETGSYSETYTNSGYIALSGNEEKKKIKFRGTKVFPQLVFIISNGGYLSDQDFIDIARVKCSAA